MRGLEAFKMWLMCTMLRISWTEHITNETVLRRMNVDREILGIVKEERQATWDTFTEVIDTSFSDC